MAKFLSYESTLRQYEEMHPRPEAMTFTRDYDPARAQTVWILCCPRCRKAVRARFDLGRLMNKWCPENSTQVAYRTVVWLVLRRMVWKLRVRGGCGHPWTEETRL
jgi:hypothetical protein